VLPATDARSLALLYHRNSEPWLNVEAYEAESYEAQHKTVEAIATPVALSHPDGVPGVIELVRKRSSCRSFAPTQMRFGQLSELIAGAYALTRVAVLPNGLELDTRAVPSAGGLYPLELYLLLHDVEHVADGLYHYNVLDHDLHPLRLGVDQHALRGALIAQPFLEHANVLVFITAVFDRTLAKYGARGYRYILFEAGHVAQNLCLLAAERELGSLCVGGFMDGKINAFLGLDVESEGTVYCIGVGHPTRLEPSETREFVTTAASEAARIDATSRSMVERTGPD
jgi:SagB-type dehydrogenase family enzyme